MPWCFLNKERTAAQKTIDLQGAGAEFGEKINTLRLALEEARDASEETERARATSLEAENVARNELQVLETKRARLKAQEEALEATLTVGDPDLWLRNADPVYAAFRVNYIGDDGCAERSVCIPHGEWVVCDSEHAGDISRLIGKVGDVDAL